MTEATKTFLAIYLGSPAAMEAWRAKSEAERKELQAKGMVAWGAWAEKHKDAIASGGAPLGKTKRVTASGVVDVRNAMAAYTIVRADSHEAAAKVFKDHPHFTMFPGEAIEVMECLPIPGM
jgi:hypothetical protein